MTKSKNTKRALWASLLSMFLCIAMLIGSTFAWFTDSVTSGKNKIVAGNLDVELEYAVLDENGTISAWKSVEDATDLFKADTLWEPGHAEVAYLRLRNAGTLALKYKFAMNIANETEATNVASNTFKLSQYLQYGLVENQNTAFANRDAAINAVTSPTALADYSKESTLEAGAEPIYLALVVYMPTTVGNEANYRGDSVPSIDLGINLVATQAQHEKDSFGNDYDKDAELPVVPIEVSTNEELKDKIANAENGSVLELKAGTYSLGTKTFGGDKDITLVAADGEDVALNSTRFILEDNAKLTVKNINLSEKAQLQGTVQVYNAAEFTMIGGSITNTDSYGYTLTTNGADTRGAKITLTGVALGANEASDWSIYCPGQADYIFRDCTVKGSSIFGAGTVTIDGCTFTHNKTWSIDTNQKYNTNRTTYKETDKQYFDAAEAVEGVKKQTSGGLSLGDAVQFDGNRGGGYAKLTKVTLKDSSFNVSNSITTDYVFGVRYVESFVEGDTETEFHISNITGETYNIPN